MEQLKKQHSEKLAMKESLRKKSDEMEVKLDRAGKLVTGLAGERVRWEERVVVRPPPHTHTYPLTAMERVLKKCTVILCALNLKKQHLIVFPGELYHLSELKILLKIWQRTILNIKTHIHVYVIQICVFFRALKKIWGIWWETVCWQLLFSHTWAPSFPTIERSCFKSG